MRALVRSRSRTVLGTALIVMGLLAGPWLLPTVATATSPDPSTSPQPSLVLEPLPDGDYLTPSLTLDQITQAMKAAGVTDALVAEWRASMPAGDEVFDLRLRDGRLDGGNLVNGGAPDFGWNGAFQFVDDHTLVADDGKGAITVGFQTDGDQVQFKVLQDLNPYPNDIIWLIAFYQAAPFRLATAAASPTVAASPSASGDPIPQGDYVSGPVDTALITSTLRAAGFSDADIQTVTSAVGATTSVFTLRLRDGVLTELQSSDGRPARDRLARTVRLRRRPHPRRRRWPGSRHLRLHVAGRRVAHRRCPGSRCRPDRFRDPDGDLRVDTVHSGASDIGVAGTLSGVLRCDIEPSKGIFAIAVLATGLLLGPAANLSANDSSSGLAPVDCPADILEFALTQTTCNAVTVPLDRSAPDGRTIQLLTVQTMPPGGTTTPDAGFGVGDGMGNGPLNTSDASAGAQRIHRVVYHVEARGLGPMSPSLDCPEVRDAGPEMAGLRIGSPAFRAALLQAVSACRARITSNGLDPSLFDMASIVADGEDARAALGLDQVNIEANDNGSLLDFEYLRRDPQALRSLITDSPDLPTADLFTVGPEALDLAISRLADLCAAQSACAARFPDLITSIAEDVDRLQQNPLAAIPVTGTLQAVKLGHPISVVVDGAALLRWIRSMLGNDDPALLRPIITTLAAVEEGRIGPNDALVAQLSADAGGCLGLIPDCTDVQFGGLYSILCRDVVPFVDHVRLTRAIAGRAAYAALFDPGPLASACDAWNVPPSDAPAPMPGGATPILVLRGWFDPYSAPASDVASVLADYPNLSLVEVPNASYNALGGNDCPRRIRNAWIDALTTPPTPFPCQFGAPPDLNPSP